MIRDQAKRIAKAIFDDIERERLFSLDRVADVIERTAIMEADRQEQEQQKAVADHLRQFEHKPKVPTYYSTPDEDLAREVKRIYARKVMDTAPGPFGGTIIATSPELAKKASQLLGFCQTPSQTIIQPDD